ncbi:MAG: ATP-binding protein [Bacteroidales bacterium]|nr:ATP-binding protein [Bacteroidales bacterium]
MKKGILKERSKILISIQKIATTLRGAGLSRKIINTLKQDIKNIAAFLDCTDREALCFSLIFYIDMTENCVTYNDINRFLACESLDLLEYYEDIDKLGIKRLVIIEMNTRRKYNINKNKTFTIREDIIKALMTADKSLIKKSGIFIKTLNDFIDWMDMLYSEREDDILSFDSLFNEIESKLKLTQELPLFKKIAKLKLSIPENLLLLYTVKQALVDINDTVDLQQVMDTFLPHGSAKYRLQHKLIRKESILTKNEIVAFEKESFMRGKSLYLTEKGVEILLGKDFDYINKNKEFKPSLSKLIEPEQIESKKLFYNEKDIKKIESLYNYLSDEHLSMLMNKLKQNKMKEGFTILMYGHPGTGKTETALQIAKKLNRKVLMPDISSVRDMFVGESEKNIKRIFKEYYSALKYYDNIPILLFNESDALISKRIGVAHSVDQMQNNMQNILLQELEDFRGIFIATTNLTSNLDEAFERRFLFKIKFELPDETVRKQIWLSKTKLLNEQEAAQLAVNFNISGGQIDNIIRKMVLHNLLNKQKLSFSEIENLCYEELNLNKAERKTIGF